VARGSLQESYACPYGEVDPAQVADVLVALGLTERQTPDLLLEAIMILIDRKIPTWQICHIVCVNTKEGRA